MSEPRSLLSTIFGSESSSDPNRRSDYGHHGYYECDTGINIAALAATLAGIAALGFILYTKITMAGRRRRKRDHSDFFFDMEILPNFSELVLHGKGLSYSFGVLVWNNIYQKERSLLCNNATTFISLLSNVLRWIKQLLDHSLDRAWEV